MKIAGTGGFGFGWEWTGWGTYVTAPDDRRLNIIGYNTLKFWIKGAAGNEEQSGIGCLFYDNVNAKCTFQAFKNYITPITTTYQLCSIPVTAFNFAGGGMDLTKIVNLEFWQDTTATVYIDDMYFF